MLSNTNEPSIEGIELFFSQADLQTLPSEEIELSARNSVLRVRKDSVPARVGMQVGDVVDICLSILCYHRYASRSVGVGELTSLKFVAKPVTLGSSAPSSSLS